MLWSPQHDHSVEVAGIYQPGGISEEVMLIPILLVRAFQRNKSQWDPNYTARGLSEE